MFFSRRGVVLLVTLAVLLAVRSEEFDAQTVVCPQTADGALVCAQQLFAAHDLEASETATRQYLIAHADSADAMYLLGHILQVRDQAKESLTWFTKAASMKKPSSEDLRVVALDYVLLNAYPQAVHWLEKSVEMDPNNAEAWYSLGRSKMMLGEMHAARAPLERSLALKPKQWKVINNLGVVDEAENQPVAAEAAYREAIEWQKDAAMRSEQPYLNLGTLLTTQQKTGEAVELLREAVKLAPNDMKCNEALAKAEEQQSDFPDAIAHLSHAVSLDPNSAHLHFELGQLYKHAGQPEKAKEEMALSGKLYGTHSSDAEQ